MFNAKGSIFQPYHDRKQITFNEMMMIGTLSWNFIVLAHALKQWSVSRYVTPLGQNILFPSHPVLVLDACLAEKQQNINFIVIGLTRPGLEPMIYCTQVKHAIHYTTDAVNGEYFSFKFLMK